MANPTAQDIIIAAYSLLGIYDTTSALTPWELKVGLDTLSDLLDSWNNQNLLVYSTTPIVLPFISGVQTYMVGSRNPFSADILNNVMTVTSGTPGNIAAGQYLIAPGVAPNTTITGIVGGNQYSLSWTAPQPLTNISCGLCDYIAPDNNNFVNSQRYYNWNIPRPVKIQSLSIQYPSGTGQPVELEIPGIDREKWQNIPQKNTQSLWPIQFYDDCAYPYRNLNMWPIPTETNANAILYVWEQLDVATGLNDSIFAPPGYAMALKYTLAEYLAPHFERVASPDIKAKALAARQAIDNINEGIPTTHYDSIWGGSRGSTMAWESRGRVVL